MNEEEAAIELLKRRQARVDMGKFSAYIEPDEPPALHHLYICKALDRVVSGEIDRLMIFLPPGSAKSTYTSVRFPPYFLGRFPKKSIISGSYGEGLSTSFGRKVRNILNTNEYSLLFDTKLSEDARAKGEWSTEEGGSYFACGVGSGVTGRRGDLGLIDDPVKGRKDADSELVRNETWDWYKADFFSRLKPGAAQIIIQCMTGDTPVLMANGKNKPLRDIKIGDRVATYDAGNIKESTVLNWANQGRDKVYKVTMKSGIIVRANKRHPFLVERNGKLEWIRLKNLIGGDRALTVIGGSGRTLNVNTKDAKNWQNAKGIVTRIIAKLGGLRDIGLRLQRKTLFLGLTQNLSIATESPSTSITRYSKNKTAFALSARKFLKNRETLSTGTLSSALTTAMIRIKSGVSFATTAISRLVTGKHRKCLSKPQNTYEITTDWIKGIVEDGYEDVFDIQIDRTENFIANGLVSHNTRWHEDDLSGRILPANWNGESGEFMGFDGQMWTVICIPAEAREDDPLGRKVGEWLWPDYYTPDTWEKIKKVQTSKDTRNWSSLYQQVPRPEQGVFFQREWFKRYPLGKHPELTLYGASDCAVTDEKDGGIDFTEHGIGGFDSHTNLYFIDWWSGRTTMDIWIDAELSMARRYPILAWVKEGGVIRRSSEPFLKKAKETQSTHYRSEWITSNANKGANARGFQALASMGQVYIPECRWGDDLLDQLVKFIPNTNFLDDKVDVCGLFGRILDQAFAPTQTKESPSPKKDGYNLDEEPDKNWKLA